MRFIRKQGTGGYHLERAHANPPITAHDATTRWNSFGYKPDVLQRLLDEQYQLCCYSELRADEEGLGYHIEHVENKHQNPQRTFEYANLAASALDSTADLPFFKAQGHELFGGHAPCKQREVDLTHFVSCHRSQCPRYFTFLSDGRVVPAMTLNPLEHDRAEYTINVLNLNSPYLVTLRRNWWDELDDLYEEHDTKGWSLLHLAAVNLAPTGNKLYRFFSLTRQFFGPAAEEALQESAPHLV